MPRIYVSVRGHALWSRALVVLLLQSPRGKALGRNGPLSQAWQRCPFVCTGLRPQRVFWGLSRPGGRRGGLRRRAGRGSRSAPVSMPSLTTQLPSRRTASHGRECFCPSKTRMSPGTKYRDSILQEPEGDKKGRKRRLGLSRLGPTSDRQTVCFCGQPLEKPTVGTARKGALILQQS